MGCLLLQHVHLNLSCNQFRCIVECAILDFENADLSKLLGQMYLLFCDALPLWVVRIFKDLHTDCYLKYGWTSTSCAASHDL